MKMISIRRSYSYFRRDSTRRRGFVFLSTIAVLWITLHLLTAAHFSSQLIEFERATYLAAPEKIRCDGRHCKPFGGDDFVKFGKDNKVFAHRGFSGGDKETGKYLTDNSVEAGLRAVEAGVFGIELDIEIDRLGVMVAAHEQNLSRISLANALVRDVDFRSLPTYQRKYVLRKVVDGALSNIIKWIGTEIPTGRKYIEEVILPNLGMVLLIDARNKDAAHAIAELSHYPEFWMGKYNVWVQVYNYDFNDAWELRDAVEALNPGPLWKLIPVVPCPHQNMLHKLAGVDILSLDLLAMFDAVLRFLHSFQLAGFNVPSFDIPVKGGCKYYDTERQIVDHLELNATFTTPNITAWYVKDCVNQWAINHTLLHLPSMTIMAPAPKYPLKVDGKMFKFDSETTRLREYDPAHAVKWMYFNAGLAQTVYECGAHISLADNLEAVLDFLQKGIREVAPHGYNFESRNQESYVFDD